MAFSSLARARGVGGLAACLAALGALGCHSGAVGGRASDAGSDAAPDTMVKLPPPDAKCSTDGPGGGLCPLNFCGAPKSVAALGVGAEAQLGADDVCTPGYVCVPDAPTADGTALQLRCVAPVAGAAAFGAACDTGAAAASRCKSDALCIQGAPVAGKFCSELCRADADCPQSSYCLEYKSEALPNGSYVNLGFCTPIEKIGGTACTREADCPADQGCVVYGGRTNLMTCQKLGGTKSVGQRCTATTDCRSGQCLDRGFHVAVNESYCSGPCGKNSDCGADQRCTRVVLNNNGTEANPFDDLVVGVCQTLWPMTVGDGCKTSADCAGAKNGGDTCATKYGLCYTAAAVSGAPCQSDQQCAFGAFCNQTIDGKGRGYCQTLGCAPGASPGSVDSCPGAHDLCAQRATERPLFACYEGCSDTSTCSRYTENYTCQASPSGADGGAPSTDAAATDAGADADASPPFVPTGICLYNQGV